MREGYCWSCGHWALLAPSSAMCAVCLDDWSATRPGTPPRLRRLVIDGH